jgi:hypothetical protein
MASNVVPVEPHHHAPDHKHDHDDPRHHHDQRRRHGAIPPDGSPSLAEHGHGFSFVDLDELRDRFAAAIIPGLLAISPSINRDPASVSRLAWLVADTMVKERSKMDSLCGGSEFFLRAAIKEILREELPPKLNYMPFVEYDTGLKTSNGLKIYQKMVPVALPAAPVPPAVTATASTAHQIPNLVDVLAHESRLYGPNTLPATNPGGPNAWSDFPYIEELSTGLIAADYYIDLLNITVTSTIDLSAGSAFVTLRYARGSPSA